MVAIHNQLKLEIHCTSIHCLVYADDLVLLSESPEGLQSSLNILKYFCFSWKLEVNRDKSKVIVFNSNGFDLI